MSNKIRGNRADKARELREFREFKEFRKGAIIIYSQSTPIPKFTILTNFPIFPIFPRIPPQLAR